MSSATSITTDYAAVDEALNAARTILKELQDGKHADSRQDNVLEARAHLDQAKTSIVMMKSEATKQKYLVRFRELDGSLSRIELLERKSAPQVQQQVHGDGMMTPQEQLNALLEAQKAMAEMESTGRGILDRLHIQRETESKISRNLKTIQSDLTASSRNVTKIQRRENPLRF